MSEAPKPLPAIVEPMALAERTLSPFVSPNPPKVGLGFGTEVSLKTLECDVFPAVKLLLPLSFAAEMVQSLPIVFTSAADGVAEADRPTLNERARFRLFSISCAN